MSWRRRDQQDPGMPSLVGLDPKFPVAAMKAYKTDGNARTT
jgi:hypothetical protein